MRVARDPMPPARPIQSRESPRAAALPITCSGSSARRRPAASPRRCSAVGSLMSQVLQCTQFWKLIWNRGFDAVLRRAAPRRPRPGSSAAPARRSAAGVTSIGIVGSFSVRCEGWFSSWLVKEKATLVSRSKERTPSGLG